VVLGNERFRILNGATAMTWKKTEKELNAEER
jgi:hypothetical protein